MIQTRVFLALNLCSSCYLRLQEVEVLVKKSIDFIVHLISIERCFHGFFFSTCYCQSLII